MLMMKDLKAVMHLSLQFKILLCPLQLIYSQKEIRIGLHHHMMEVYIIYLTTRFPFMVIINSHQTIQRKMKTNEGR